MWLAVVAVIGWPVLVCGRNLLLAIALCVPRPALLTRLLPSILCIEPSRFCTLVHTVPAICTSITSYSSRLLQSFDRECLCRECPRTDSCCGSARQQFACMYLLTELEYRAQHKQHHTPLLCHLCSVMHSQASPRRRALHTETSHPLCLLRRGDSALTAPEALTHHLCADHEPRVGVDVDDTHHAQPCERRV